MTAGGAPAGSRPRRSPLFGGRRSTYRRLQPLLVTIVVAVAAAACGAGGPARYTSATVRSRVADSVLHTLDGRGVPVAFDRIDCHMPASSPNLVCLGTTADEPTRDITARFQPSARPPARPGARSGAARSCPGTLTIGLDTTTLSRQELDPCR